MAARHVQGGLLSRFGEHKGEADRGMAISPDQIYTASWLLRQVSTWRSTRPFDANIGEDEGNVIISLVDCSSEPSQI